ncbi:MAG: glycosyltransferase family 4 protein [bacterium]|nr:glycosyltransferase family 4 protein [bacterium]MDD5354419.1 glycosyltransferase family 4 protein [bacterium]MDD5755707.1 glycosyltransferase family 4 protein [bacterium]
MIPKILFIEDHREIGGGQMNLLALLKALPRDICQPVLLCPEGELQREAVVLGLPVRTLAMPVLKNLNLSAYWQAVKEIQDIIFREQVDVVHANSLKSNLVGGVAAKLAHKPLLWHVRVLYRHPVLDVISFFLADKVLLVSQAVRQRFLPGLRRSHKMTVIYNGVDVIEYEKTPAVDIRKEYSLAPGALLVGMAGRLNAGKGFEYFVQAAELVLKVQPEACFLIVGGDFGSDGSYRRKIEKLVTGRGLKDKVIFTGFREDIIGIIKSLDVFVLSSESESFGRVLVEAMACGVPVIASRVGGIPEVVGEDSGILVERGNVLAFSQAISMLLSDKNRKVAITAQAAKRVQALFNIQTNIDSFIAQLPKDQE